MVEAGNAEHFLASFAQVDKVLHVLSTTKVGHLSKVCFVFFHTS